MSGLTPGSDELLKHYQELYDADPFSEDTIEAGTNLNDHIKETEMGRDAQQQERVAGLLKDQRRRQKANQLAEHYT